MLLLLQTVLLLLILGAWFFYGISALCTWQFFSSKPAASTNVSNILVHPPVSLLVPVCGLDENAWENWFSLCQQNYPDYEVLFGVVDPEDPAVPVLRQLAATFPDRVRLFVGLVPRGINHKDSSLTYLLQEARYEILIFADSDIHVAADYIQTVAAPLSNPAVGLVTCAYVAYQPQFIGSALAALGRCCDFIPSVLVARRLDGKLKFAIGVTMATRRTILNQAGGLQLNRIGSDYNLGKRIAAAGYRVELSRTVLDSDTGRESIGSLYARELRWARTIRFNRGSVYYAMIFCYGVVYCLPLLLLAHFQIWAIALTLITLIIRYLGALIAIDRIGCSRLVNWLWLLPFRDLLSWLIWLQGAFGKTVFWRGRRLQIEGDGLISEEKKFLALPVKQPIGSQGSEKIARKN